MNSEIIESVSAAVQNVERTLNTDVFFSPGRTTTGQISDLRWSVVRLARAVAALLPDESFAGTKREFGFGD